MVQRIFEAWKPLISFSPFLPVLTARKMVQRIFIPASDGSPPLQPRRLSAMEAHLWQNLCTIEKEKPTFGRPSFRIEAKEPKKPTFAPSSSDGSPPLEASKPFPAAKDLRSLPLYAFMQVYAVGRHIYANCMHSHSPGQCSVAADSLDIQRLRVLMQKW